jgi:lysophospholipid acyltransferase (LPLAT)-like uncharacterized protein
VRFLWQIVAWPAAFVAWAWIRLVLSTVRRRVDGAPADGPAIYVCWHRHTGVLSLHHAEQKRWHLVSPAPYILPLRRLGQLLGGRMALGASGDGGARGLEELAAILRRGESVAMAIDGPAGPPFRAKRGCARLAREVGVPIVPMAYRTRSARTITRRWDRMLWVRFFDELTYVYGAPISPASKDEEQLLVEVAAALDALDPRDGT